MKKSLQESCVQLIVAQIDRFSHAFNVTTDAELKRNFEFLQRVYSAKVLALFRKHTVKEEYFPLLINKHLTEFNASILDHVHFDWATITQMIAKIGEGLLKISFFGTPHHISDPSYSNIFPHLRNITVLNMPDICNDEALKNIAKYCPHLVELDVSYSKVTSEGVKKYLCQKNERNEVPNLNLRKLNLTRVNDDLTELILTSFPHLEELEARNCIQVARILHKIHQRDISQNNFLNVRKFKLVSLNLLGCEDFHTDEFFKLYSLICPDVNFLTAEAIYPDEFNVLATFKKLTKLVLSYLNEYDSKPNINNLLNSTGTRLTVLHLQGFSLSVEILINSCPLLQELDLKYIFFQPVVQTSAKALKFLKEFSFTSNLTDDASTSKSICPIILSARALEDIYFINCNFLTDELINAITYCCTHCPIERLYFINSVTELRLLQSILLSSSTLKTLRIVPRSSDNLSQDDVDLLANIAYNLENKPLFDYEEYDYFSYDYTDDDFDFDDY